MISVLNKKEIINMINDYNTSNNNNSNNDHISNISVEKKKIVIPSHLKNIAFNNRKKNNIMYENI